MNIEYDEIFAGCRHLIHELIKYAIMSLSNYIGICPFLINSVSDKFRQI